MAREGHCQPLPHGSELAAQVGYRLSGMTPDKSASRIDQERQIDYRIGSGSVDSRQVWFLGGGATAEHLAYRPGEQLTDADGSIVRDAMFGIDRRTGERIRVREERNRAARVAAAPVFSALRDGAAAAGIDLGTAWTGRNLAAQLRSLQRAAQRPHGTVAFTTADRLVRSIESAWERRHRTPSVEESQRNRPVMQPNRSLIYQRLGAYHRALHEAGEPQVFAGKAIDLSASDEVIGAWVWEQVEQQSRQMVVRGNAGYEMTLTCPKSFSVAALLDDPRRRDLWLEVMRDAVTDAVDDLMARVGHGRTGHSGDGQQATAIRGDGYAATVSIESHSRELDPHLHGHVMIPNRVVCVDGVERAIATGGADLVNHAWWVQAQFERRLRALSVARGLVTGWEMDLTARQWEVAGADPDVMGFFSQGHALVRAAVAEALDGEPGVATKARMRLLDSRAKRKVTGRKGDTQLSWEQIRARMLHRAERAGIDLATVFARPAPRPECQPQAWTPDVWARTIEQVVCEHKSAEITARIDAAVRCFAPHEWDDEQLRDLTRQVIATAFTTGTTSSRGRVGVRKHASNRILDAEQRAWTAFTAGIDANTHRLDPDSANSGLRAWRDSSGWAADGRDFTPGQAALFRQMTTGPDRVSTVVGAAGSGKTTAIDAARHVLAAHGQQVYGVCVAAIAAQGLRDAARVQAGTVTWLVSRIDFARNPLHPARAESDRLERSTRRADTVAASVIRRRYALPVMDHLVIDEASMIPATDLATILEWASAQDVTVTLVGDHKQLQAIGPSSLFPQFHAARPGAELTENLRQQTDIGRECAAFLRDGDAESALLALADTGQLLVVASQVEAERALVTAWADKAAQAHDPLDRVATCAIETQRNDQVDILNALARRTARERGWITGPDTTYTDRGTTVTYAPGDQVIVTRNIRRPDGSTLANGTRGIVWRTEPDRVLIATRDETGRLHTDHLNRRQAVRSARHGYALTTHKLQGQTVRSLVIDVGPDRDLSSTYVALTRHRDDVLAVINIADIATGPDVERLIAAGPDARRDAVIAMTAAAIQQRGFSTAPTAHDALGQHLSTDVRAAPGLAVPRAYGADQHLT